MKLFVTTFAMLSLLVSPAFASEKLRGEISLEEN